MIWIHIVKAREELKDFYSIRFLFSLATKEWYRKLLLIMQLLNAWMENPFTFPDFKKEKSGSTKCPALFECQTGVEDGN